MPLNEGVVVFLKGENEYQTESDSLGIFLFENVKIGNYKLKILSVDYYNYEKQIIVDSNTTSNLEFKLKAQITNLSSVEITQFAKNYFKSTSSYSFDSENFRNTSATMGDPSRVVQILPGVISTGNGSNAISVRGNNPYNNNWYIDGIQVPNPNHFGVSGTSNSGLLGVFNENNLKGFEFYSGGYPAMFYNSNSSIFDFKLKSGSILKRNTFAKVNFLSIGLGFDGYFKKNRKSNYIFTGKIFDTRLVNLTKYLDNKNLVIPRFADFTYKINLPLTNKFTISIFGFGASSFMQSLYSNYIEEFQNIISCNNLSANFLINNKIQFKSIVQFSETSFASITPTFYGTNKLNQTEKTIRSNTFLTIKKLNKYNLMLGYQNMIGRQQIKERFNADTNIKITYPVNNHHVIYMNIIKTLTSKSQLTTGINTIWTPILNILSFEPKISISTQVNKYYVLRLNGGVYSRSPYVIDQYGNAHKFNKSYKLLKSGQFVIANEFELNNKTSIKFEAYFQRYWNVPIGGFYGNTSVLNQLEYKLNYGYPITAKDYTYGKNSGLDFYLSKSYASRINITSSVSVFSSKFLDKNGVWNNNIFNNKFNSVFSINKEWFKTKNYGSKVFNLSTKIIYGGGFYDYNIDLNSSKQANREIIDNLYVYNKKLPNTFRIDIGFQITYSKSKYKSELRFDIQNLTNRKNIINYYYNTTNQQIEARYQFPIIPIIGYSLYF